MTEPQMPVVQPPVWDNIPPELANRQQWLLWKFESKPGQTKPGKIPYYVQGGRRTGGQGDDRDRQRLATLAVAQRAFARGGWTGIGFAFLPGDGLIGIDIDGAIDPASGEVSKRCAAIIGACVSYTEYSPSGKGVHIIVQGETQTNKSNDIGLEVFCGRQFFTFTGQLYPGLPAHVHPIDEGVLKRLHTTIDDAKEQAKAAKAQPSAGAASAGSVPAASARPQPGLTGSADDFRRVNDVAMKALHAWVPVLFPKATTKGMGYRVTSNALGRDLQEDLSIAPEGIVDFGVADMGDARQGCRSPVDLVMEWLPAPKAKDALHWLAQCLGVDVAQTPAQGAKKARAEAKNTPEKQATSAAGAAPAGGGGGGDDLDKAQLIDRLILRRGHPLDCRENVMYCLQLDPELHDLVKQNEFTHLLERSRTTPWGHPAGEWNEEDDLMLGEYLLRNYGMAVKATSTLRNGVLMAARSAKYNPVLDMIHAQKWDGIDRLEHWMSDVYEVADRPYTRLIGKLFMMGLVKRAISPGCKFDYMLIIKGEQGLKKSSAFRALAYPFFTDNAIRMGDKDSLMAMQLVWIAESSELESLNKSETTQIKQFLAAQEDLFRPPYGSQLIKAKRHSVNVGTTNADTFLKDATGDRRFWPLEVKVVNADVLIEQRLQLFAEALHRLNEGERYWPTPQEERELVFPEQEPFKRTDTWEDMIDAYVNRETSCKDDPPNEPANARRAFFTTIELYDKALFIKADRIDGAGNMDTRIGNAMRALGFDRHRETGGKRRRGFLRRPVDATPSTPTAPLRGTSGSTGPVGSGAHDPVSEDDDLPL